MPADAPPPVDALDLAGQPSTSKMHWLRPDASTVPVDVSASGPRMIAVAARNAQRITFGVGANVERLQWAIETARSAAGDNPVSLGAHVNVVAHPDLEIGRKLASGTMSTFARFNVMHGATNGPMFDGATETLDRLHDAYDMRFHTRGDSPQAAQLDPEFVDQFGIVGPSSYCVERLQELERARPRSLHDRRTRARIGSGRGVGRRSLGSPTRCCPRCVDLILEFG